MVHSNKAEGNFWAHRVEHRKNVLTWTTYYPDASSDEEVITPKDHIAAEVDIIQMCYRGFCESFTFVLQF